MKKNIDLQKIKILPLTSERWSDFETLFNSNRNCSGCWCMWWRVTNKQFDELGKIGLKEASRTLVHQGVEPGLLAYAEDTPIGWVALAPRKDYVRLNKSRLLSAVDDQPVWVISCFVIHPDYRGQGLMEKMIAAACEYARSKKVTILEAFPLRITDKTKSSDLYVGVESAFLNQGFEVVANRNNRPIMRKNI